MAQASLGFGDRSLRPAAPSRAARWRLVMIFLHAFGKQFARCANRRFLTLVVAVAALYESTSIVDCYSPDDAYPPDGGLLCVWHNVCTPVRAEAAMAEETNQDQSQTTSSSDKKTEPDGERQQTEQPHDEANPRWWENLTGRGEVH
jgi:hypothetical protein